MKDWNGNDQARVAEYVVEEAEYAEKVATVRKVRRLLLNEKT